MVTSDSIHPFADLFTVSRAPLADIPVPDMVKLLDVTTSAVINSEATKELFTQRIDLNRFSKVDNVENRPQYRAFLVFDPSLLRGFVVWLASKTDGKHWIVTYMLDGSYYEEMTNIELAQFLRDQGFNLTDMLTVANSMIASQARRRADLYRSRADDLNKVEIAIRTVTEHVSFVARNPTLMSSFRQTI